LARWIAVSNAGESPRSEKCMRIIFTKVRIRKERRIPLENVLQEFN